MAELILQTATILPRTKRLQPTGGAAGVFEHEPPESHPDLGHVMGIIEALGPAAPAEDLIASIKEIAAKHYHRPLPASTTLEDRFAATMRAINRYLLAQPESGRLVGLVVAAIANDQLHISAFGSVTATLYRRGHASSMIDQESIGNSTLEWIASGSLQNGDHLVMATPALQHQVSETELSSIVANARPSVAAQRLQELTDGQPNLNRAAAIICGLLTPEMLAMQATDEEPDDSAPNHSLQRTRAPKGMPVSERLANVAAQGSRSAIGLSRRHLVPGAKKAANTSYRGLRNLARTTRGRQVIGGVVLVLIGLGLWLNHNHGVLQSTKDLQARYNADFGLYQAAQRKAETGDKPTAREDLQRAKDDLQSLSAASNNADLNRALKNASHPSGDPADIKKLLQLVNTQQDELEQLTRLTPTTFKDFGHDPTAPALMTLAGNSLVTVSHLGLITSLDPATGKTKNSVKPPGDFKNVVAITTNSDDDGVLLLTDEPGVWQYDLATNQLNRVGLSFGNWPTARSIATYNGNLYLLTADTVTKQTPTLAGYSTPTTSYHLEPGDTGASSLAIDGNIYIGGTGAGITRVTAGKSTGKTTGAPFNFQLIHPQPVDDNTLIALDKSTSKIAVFNLAESDMPYRRDYILINVNSAGDIQYDARLHKLFLLTGSKILSAALSL